ncbi:MAG: glycosyltransferase [Aerococcaceae bacterium]|nr:glycosyltransferase [Aerococcaceae bacterium]
MARLCLNMIVKNEAPIIEETLRLVCAKFPIDYWVISDTGSTDGTQDIIQQTMIDLRISGELHQDRWINFGDSRQRALDHARGKADYILFFDADDTIEGDVRIPFEQGQDAFYADFKSEDSSTTYSRILVVKDGVAKWRGVLHEFVELADQSRVSDLEGNYHVVSRRLGNRSQQPNKYLMDAELLARAIEEGRDPDLYTRYLFYCAQSYRDAGVPSEAKKWYLRRAEEASGWAQERYVSYLNLGYLAESEADHANALYYWGLATTIDPYRMEAWYHLTRLHHWNNRPQMAYLFAQHGAELNYVHTSLFASRDIYDYWMTYENFMLAYDCRDFARSYQFLKRLIASPAPQYLYLNQENRIRDLARFVKEDTHENVQKLIQTVRDKQVDAVLGWLNLV